MRPVDLVRRGEGGDRRIETAEPGLRRERRRIADQQRPADGGDAGVERRLQRDLGTDAGRIADRDSELFRRPYSSFVPPFGFRLSGSSRASFTRIACFTNSTTFGEGLTILPAMPCSSAPPTGLMSI